MKKDISKAGFTLIELLVVITILAIISITAYTNFSGSTDKAKNSTKLGHIASIETGLNTFFMDKNYYPMPSQYAAKNLWGYNSTPASASLCNTFTGAKSGEQILSVSWTLMVGGGKVNDATAVQIGAKGTIDSDVLSKQYLSQELADPAIKDIKVGGTEVFKDYWLGEYVYGVYAKSNADWTSTSKKGSAYNVAMVISDEQKWGAVTKISGNFDKSICVGCPDSLIGGGGAVATNSLKDGDVYTGSLVDSGSVRMAYPISGF